MSPNGEVAALIEVPEIVYSTAAPGLMVILLAAPTDMALSPTSFVSARSLLMLTIRLPPRPTVLMALNKPAGPVRFV